MPPIPPFTIQTLTPTYLGGPLPRQLDPHTPIRPTAIRGALRAWFRAAAASVLLPIDGTHEARANMIAALRDVEAKVFGDTKNASPFVVLPPASDKLDIDHRQRIPEPSQFPGLRYLGYGIFDNAPTPELGVIKEQSTFELKLAIRRPFDQLADLLTATVWLWTHLGGLGARSRRGFGSLRLVDGDLAVFDKFAKKPVATPTSIQSLVDDSLIAGIDGVMAIFEQHLPKLTTHPLYAAGAKQHPALRAIDGIRFINTMRVGAVDGMRALDQAGRIFREYRSTLERRKLDLPPLPDYFAVKQSLERRVVPNGVDRTAFGLPLSFYFRSLGGTRTEFAPQEGGRLPSPLHFRVHQVHEPGGPRPVVTLLNLAQGEGAEVLLGCRIQQSVQRSTMPWKVPTPRVEVIDDAIHWMVERAHKLYGSPSRGKQS